MVIDSVRSKSLLSRGTEEWVVRWFRKAGVGSTLDPLFVPGLADKETMSRWVVPVHAGGRILGYLCILDPESTCTAAQLNQLSDQSTEIGRIMAQSEESARLASDRLKGALTGHGTENALDMKDLQELQGTGVREWAIAVGASIHCTTDQGSKGARPAPATRTGVRSIIECKFEDHHAFLLAGNTDIEPATLMELAPCCPMLVVGVGDPVRDPYQLPRSYRQAVAALRTATANESAPNTTTRWNELGSVKVLSLQDADVLSDTVASRIAALSSETELLETVEHYLDHGRKPDLVADSLHIHRGTLYYRLRKFEEATGMNLESGQDRLSIQLSLAALKLLRAPAWQHAT